MAGMRPREWLLSAGFVAFLALKVLEAAYQVERWPLTHAPMFARRLSAATAPVRITLHGKRGGRWAMLRAGELGLTDDELGRRIGGPDASLASRCAALGAAYDARPRQPWRRPLEALEARVERIARPGTAMQPSVQVVPCPLATRAQGR